MIKRVVKNIRYEVREKMVLGWDEGVVGLTEGMVEPGPGSGPGRWEMLPNDKVGATGFRAGGGMGPSTEWQSPF